LEIAARIGNTGGLDFLIRTTRPWETSVEIEGLKSIASDNITDPTKKNNFMETLTILCRLYQNDQNFMLGVLSQGPQNNKEFILKVLKGCSEKLRSNEEFILGALKGCSKELRNNREFILELIKQTANRECYVSIMGAIGGDEKLINEEGFIGEAIAALRSVLNEK
jgi:hypothetical protein